MAAPQTVLIVEDDEAIASSVAYSLDRAGYRTLRAGDGAQALRLFRQQRPDLVILDLMLPQMDGWRVMDELRREDARVPVIVCSARTSEFDRVHGLEMGADDYVTKPFSMKELLARVQAHLRRVESHRRPDGDEPIEVDGLRIDPEQVQAFVDGASVGLTPREFDVQARNPENSLHIGGDSMAFGAVYGPPFVRQGEVDDLVEGLDEPGQAAGHPVEPTQVVRQCPVLLRPGLQALP